MLPSELHVRDCSCFSFVVIQIIKQFNALPILFLHNCFISHLKINKERITLIVWQEIYFIKRHTKFIYGLWSRVFWIFLKHSLYQIYRVWIISYNIYVITTHAFLCRHRFLFLCQTFCSFYMTLISGHVYYIRTKKPLWFHS